MGLFSLGVRVGLGGFGRFLFDRAWGVGGLGIAAATATATMLIMMIVSRSIRGFPPPLARSGGRQARRKGRVIDGWSLGTMVTVVCLPLGGFFSLLLSK